MIFGRVSWRQTWLNRNNLRRVTAEYWWKLYLFNVFCNLFSKGLNFFRWNLTCRICVTKICTKLHQFHSGFSSFDKISNIWIYLHHFTSSPKFHCCVLMALTVINHKLDLIINVSYDLLTQSPWAGVVSRSSSVTKWSSRMSRERFDLELPNFTLTSMPVGSTTRLDMASLATSGQNLSTVAKWQKMIHSFSSS